MEQEDGIALNEEEGGLVEKECIVEQKEGVEKCFGL